MILTRYRTGWVALFALTVLFLTSAAPDQEKPNFLLITIDTWRADYISASGSRKVQTPFIDKLAREGVYLRKVDSPDTFTTPAHASIMTGLYPVNHGIRDNSHFRLKKGVRTMAELFKENGYFTIGVVSGEPLKKYYGLDRGFDIYDDDGLCAKGVESEDAASSKDGRKTAERAQELIRTARTGNLFIWLHLYDPHYPYAPPPELINRYLDDPYAGEVAYVDKVIGEFVTSLLKEKRGKWMILLTGDHGESLGENGEETHGLLLYKQTREVPLILWRSDGKKDAFGTGVKSLIDIFPTIAELFSFPPPECDGVSLSRNTTNTRWLFSETYFPTMSFGLNPALLARKDEAIYIKHGTSSEVYQGGDEKNNLYESRKIFAAAAEAEMKKLYGEGRIPPSNLKITDEEKRVLTSLGYIGSFEIPRDISPCDLRVFSQDFSKYFSRGQEEIKKGDLNKALSCYDIILGKYPKASIFHFEKGGLFIQMKRFGDAKEEFETCLRLDPGNSDAMLNLGAIMKMEGKPQEAEKFYLSSLERDEEQALLHLNLGVLYGQDLKNDALAIKHLQRFLELDPGYVKKKEVENLIKVLKNKNK